MIPTKWFKNEHHEIKMNTYYLETLGTAKVAELIEGKRTEKRDKFVRSTVSFLVIAGGLTLAISILA